MSCIFWHILHMRATLGLISTIEVNIALTAFQTNFIHSLGGIFVVMSLPCISVVFSSTCSRQCLGLA